MNFPENLKYSKDHEWIKVEGDTALVGITEFAQSELGEIVYVDVTSEGETIEQNGVFGSVEARKTVSDLFDACIRRSFGSKLLNWKKNPN